METRKEETWRIVLAVALPAVARGIAVGVLTALAAAGLLPADAVRLCAGALGL